MAENVGNSDARPDLDLEEELEGGPDAVEATDATITEQEMAEAEAGCGQVAISVPVGHPAIPEGMTEPPAGHPAGVRMGGHPAGVPGGPGGHPAGIPMERQRHGGARSVGFRPGGGPQAIAYEERTGIKAPRIIAWEITRSCNLSCVHCRAAAEFGHYHGELSLDQIKATIDDIVTISNPIIILTGGEPLMRPDIWEIVDYAQEKGAMPVIGTNATLITEEIAQQMHDHGIPRISVSVDFPTAAEHDDFRQQEGCFDATIEGIKMAKRHGVGVQINTTVTTRNADKIEQIHDLAEELGVDAFHIFMLVPTGRGSELLAEELPPED
jgi:sulfatase maturation enzyme AslB (radical SAM superfamily)